MIFLKIIPEYEALQIIFSTWGNVRVVAPDELKDKACRIANKLLEYNQ